MKALQYSDLDKFKEQFFEGFASIKELNKEVYDFIIKKNKSLKFQKPDFLNSIVESINEATDKKKIVFLSFSAAHSLIRKSIYLRKNGFSTILLINDDLKDKFYRNFFDYIYTYKSFLNLAYILFKIKPNLVHVQWMISRSNYLGILAKLFCQTKVVFEFYDLPNLYFSKEDANLLFGEKEAELIFFIEKFAFQKLDGAILYYSSKIFPKLKKKFCLKAPLLEFHHYVCNEFISDKNEKLSKRDGKIHLVYGGHIAPLMLPPRLFGDVQFHELISVITKQNIFFDIYFNPGYKNIVVLKLFWEYIGLKIKNPFFSFKRGLPLWEAPKEFSQYDFGVMFYFFNKGSRLTEHNKNVIPTKFFSYLEAGLPVIVSEELECLSSLVKEYEIGIVVSQEDIENLSKIILSFDYQKLSWNVKQARKELSMQNNIQRLINFYM